MDITITLKPVILAHVTTQYCDGLRGPLVIYDPDDPHAALYDIDDGSHPNIILSYTVLNF